MQILRCVFGAMSPGGQLQVADFGTAIAMGLSMSIRTTTRPSFLTRQSVAHLLQQRRVEVVR